MTSFVAVDEQSRVTGEALRLEQPVPMAQDARFQVAKRSMPIQRTRLAEWLDSDDSSFGCVIEQHIHEPRRLSRIARPNPMDFLSGTPRARLQSACALAESRDWAALAEGLAFLEETLHLLSHPVAPCTDPSTAVTMLLMMLACTPRRQKRDDLPELLHDFDLSRTGESWQQWMAVLEPLKREPRWRTVIAAAERGDAISMAKSAAKLTIREADRSES